MSVRKHFYVLSSLHPYKLSSLVFLSIPKKICFVWVSFLENPPIQRKLTVVTLKYGSDQVSGKPGMMAHTWNSSTQEAEAGFEVILGYIASSRPTWTV